MSKKTRENKHYSSEKIQSEISNILKENPYFTQMDIKKRLEERLEGYETSQSSVHRYLNKLQMKRDQEKGWVHIRKDAQEISREKLSKLLKEELVKERISPVQLTFLQLEEGYAGLFEAQIKGGYEEALAGTLVMDGGLLLAVQDNEEGAELLSILGFEQKNQ